MSLLCLIRIPTTDNKHLIALELAGDVAVSGGDGDLEVSGRVPGDEAGDGDDAGDLRVLAETQLPVL